MTKPRAKKPGLVIIKDEFYRTYVVVMVGDQIKKLWKFIKPWVLDSEKIGDLEKLLTFRSDTTAGFTTQLPNGQVIIRLREEMADWPVLNHELVHAAKMVLGFRGQRTGGMSDESLPYYVQFLTSKLVEAGW